MKIFRTTWENPTGHGCVSNWHHTVADAKAEAREYDGVWKTVETAKFQPFNNAENIRRFMNSENEILFETEHILRKKNNRD